MRKALVNALASSLVFALCLATVVVGMPTHSETEIAHIGHESISTLNCAHDSNRQIPLDALHRCGFVSIRPPNFDKSIDIWVEVIGGPDDRRYPPVLIAPGGPGLAATEYIDSLLNTQALIDGRDLIFADPVGTGRSEGRLICGELLPLDGECDGAVVAEGVPITAFSSAGTAAAFQEIGNELGVEQWDVISNSYGGDAAFRLLASDPTRVRAAVFTAPSSPFVAEPLHDAKAQRDATERALNLLCEGDPICSGSEQGLVERWRLILLRLGSDPLELHPASRQEIGPTGATGTAFALIENDLTELLPSLLVALEQGDIESWKLLDGWDEPTAQAPDHPDPPFEIADLEQRLHEKFLYVAFICQDGVAEAPQPTPDMALHPYHDPVWTHSLHQEQCSKMGIETGRVVSNYGTPPNPTLMIAGELDPRIAMDDVIDLADAFANSRLITLRWSNHWILQRSCTLPIIVSFLDNPQSIDGDFALADNCHSE